MHKYLFILTLLQGIYIAEATPEKKEKAADVAKNEDNQEKNQAGCPDQCIKVAEAINHCAKAVVNLYVLQVNDEVFNPFLNDPAFRFFFGGNIPNQPQVIQGSGSGVILRKEGLLVTCAHVVKGAKKIRVRLNDGREFDGDTIYINPDYDIAFVQIKKDSDEELPVAQIGDSDELVVTQPIYLVGNAFGIGQSITSGIVSAINRIVDNKVLLQTDAAANPGNSGGGVFAQNGLYIGTPNAIATKTGANHGVGFVIPSNLVKAILERVENKTIDADLWIGLTLQELTYSLAKAFKDFPVKTYHGGVIVTQVNDNSPFKEELKPQDVILKVNGKKISTLAEFHQALFINTPKTKMKLTVWRQEKGEVDVLAEPISVPESEKTKAVTIEGQHILNGYTIAEVTDALLQKEDIDRMFKGKIVIQNAPEKRPATMFGMTLEVGDIILKINNKNMESTQDIVNILKESGLKSMVVQRGGSTMTFSFG